MSQTSSEHLYERIPGGTIEAVQNIPSNSGILFEWTEEAFQPGNGVFPARLWVAANQAMLDVEEGEWVAKDSLGFYPIKNEVFQRSWRKPIEAPSLVENSAGALLNHLGIDGIRWAETFVTLFPKLKIDGSPGSLVHGWFANAIEAGVSAGYSKGLEAGRDPKSKEVDLSEYTNNSRGGDRATVRRGDTVSLNYGYARDRQYVVSRIFKPTPDSRVRYEFTGEQPPARWNFASYYRKVSQ